MENVLLLSRICITISNQESNQMYYEMNVNFFDQRPVPNGCHPMQSAIIGLLIHRVTFLSTQLAFAIITVNNFVKNLY
jgi:hypothetical protein